MPSAWAGSITVQVGYADSLRPSPFLPSNICNGGTQFDGASGASCSGQVFDSGAIRIINSTGGVMTVSDVRVTINTGVVYDLWNPGGSTFTIADGTDEVLTQTFGENFDSSDNSGFSALPGDGFDPIISITFTDPNVAGGAVSVLNFNDTGQILNTGGFDSVFGINGVCIGGNNNATNNFPGNCNESLQWRDIGTSNFTNPGGNTPEPSSIVLLLTGAAALVGFARRFAA